MAVSWFKYKGFSYKNVGVYIIDGVEEIASPTKLPTPPTPPTTPEELTPYIFALLREEYMHQ